MSLQVLPVCFTTVGMVVKTCNSYDSCLCALLVFALLAVFDVVLQYAKKQLSIVVYFTAVIVIYLVMFDFDTPGVCYNFCFLC